MSTKMNDKKLQTHRVSKSLFWAVVLLSMAAFSAPVFAAGPGYFGEGVLLAENDATPGIEMDLFSADLDGDEIKDLIFTGKDNKISWSKGTAGGDFGAAQMIFIMAQNPGKCNLAPPADMDNDGDLDIVLAHGSYIKDEGTENEEQKWARVIWMENTAGDASAWEEHVVKAYEVATGRVYPCVADFNNDDALDIAFSCEESQQPGEDEKFTRLSMAVNDKSGSFHPASDIYTRASTSIVANYNPHFYLEVAPVDQDDDGFMDIRVKTYNPKENIVSYQYCKNVDGTGIFEGVYMGLPAYASYPGHFITSLDDSDLNGDGRTDRIAAGVNEAGTSGGIFVKLASIDLNIPGSALEFEFLKGCPVEWAKAMDINGDGNMDIVASIGGSKIGEGGSENHDRVVWLKNFGKGSFPEEPRVIQDSSSGAVLVNDFNDDDLPDLVLGKEEAAHIYKYENQGPREEWIFYGDMFKFGDEAEHIYFTDVDKDEDLDIVACGDKNHIFWHPNDGNAIFDATKQEEIFKEESSSGAGCLAEPVVIGEQEKLCLISSHGFCSDGKYGKIHVHQSRFPWWDKKNGEAFETNGKVLIDTADFNKDGKLDVFAVHGQMVYNGDIKPFEFSLFTYSGDFPGHNLDKASIYTYTPELVRTDISFLSAGNVDGDVDGNIDIFYALQGRRADRTYYTSLFYLPGNGDGTFAAPIEIHTMDIKTTSGCFIKLVEATGDGNLDILMGLNYNNADRKPIAALDLLPGTGSGSFGGVINLASVVDQDLTYQAATVADFDQDQDKDILVAARKKLERNKYLLQVFSFKKAGADFMLHGALLYSGYCEQIESPKTIKIKDLNKDGKPEIILGTDEYIGILSCPDEFPVRTAEDVVQDARKIGGQGLAYDFDPDTSTLTITGTVSHLTGAPPCDWQQSPDTEYWIGIAIKKPAGTSSDIISLISGGGQYKCHTMTEDQGLLYHYKYDHSSPWSNSRKLDISWSPYLPPETITIDASGVTRPCLSGHVDSGIFGHDAPVQGCTVTIKGTDLSVQTDSVGNFYFADLLPGHYDLVFKMNGFKSQTKHVFVGGEETVVEKISIDMDNTTPGTGIFGDANLDGRVDIIDSTTVLQILSKTPNTEE